MKEFEIMFNPAQSFIHELYSGVQSQNFKDWTRTTQLRYNKILISRFYRDYFKSLVSPVKFLSSAYKGKPKLILDGFQELIYMLRPALEKSGVEKIITNYFSSQNLDLKYTRDVMVDLFILDLLDGFYKSSKKSYLEQLTDILIEGKKDSFYLIGPQHAQNNPAYQGKGMKIRIPTDSFDIEKISEIVWSFMYKDYFKLYRDKDIKSIYNIRDEIKAPILHIYDQLYKALTDYNENYYEAGENAEFEKNVFHVVFYTPRISGMSASGNLGSEFTVKLDLSDPIGFQKNIARVVYLMVKNMATIVVKQGFETSKINVLYANQFKILDEGYIKQNFYGQQIGGSVVNQFRVRLGSEQWIDSILYRELKQEYESGAFTLKNAFPISAFHDADKFDELFSELISHSQRILIDFRPEDLS
jgi:hypothetical protein